MSLRGVTPAALLVHPGVRIVAGRFPAEPGELLIGRLVTENLGAVGIGSEISVEGRPHRVVGVLAAEGQIFESELWMTLEDLRGRSGDREASAVVLRTASARAAHELVERLEKSRQVNVSAKTEPEYYAQIQRASTAFVYLGNLIGALLGLGAVVAGANTMYATMSRRIREMGTLRALGFGRWRVGAALLLESATRVAARRRDRRAARVRLERHRVLARDDSRSSSRSAPRTRRRASRWRSRSASRAASCPRARRRGSRSSRRCATCRAI